MRGIGRPGACLALLAVLTIGGWSFLFSSTYDYSFFWDDLHFIRCYSWPELQSTFHGPNDPDGIETPALRPVATMLFHAQGCLFGENIRAQRAFMAALMGILLWTLGLLLRQVGLSTAHVVVVFALFASSRVFACLILWITLGSVILAYIFAILAALFFLRWAREGRRTDLGLLALAAALATFTREEAYTLPFVLPMLWCLSSRPRSGPWRRPLSGATLVLAIVTAHLALRALFIADAPIASFSLKAWRGVLTSIASAWCPGGLELAGLADRLLGLAWRSFLGALALALLRDNAGGVALPFWGTCALGCVLCAPAFALARSFGIALPSIAFFTAVSMGAIGVLRRTRPRPLLGPAALLVVVGGLVVGVAGGMRRSREVADSLHANCASKVLRDGLFLFDREAPLYRHHKRRQASIPPERRRAGLERLASLGIRSPMDLSELERDMLHRRKYLRNQETRSALFLPRYDYKSF